MFERIDTRTENVFNDSAHAEGVRALVLGDGLSCRAINPFMREAFEEFV